MVSREPAECVLELNRKKNRSRTNWLQGAAS